MRQVHARPPHGYNALFAGAFQFSMEVETRIGSGREDKSEDCTGADAYMISEDPEIGEVGSSTLLVRLANVPEFDGF